MNFKEALKFRHACKIFDENKKISDDDFEAILEAGRLAPSSLGLQQWEFELIENAELKAQIRKACWDQVQITSCSHLLVIYAKIADLRPNSPYLRDRIFARTDKDDEQKNAYLTMVNNFLRENCGQSEIEIFAWTKAQCFLAAQNMMMQAAFLGIDSCPIEGYVESDLNRVLGLNPSQKRVAMLLPLGYRVKEPKPSARRKIYEILSVR